MESISNEGWLTVEREGSDATADDVGPIVITEEGVIVWVVGGDVREKRRVQWEHVIRRDGINTTINIGSDTLEAEIRSGLESRGSGRGEVGRDETCRWTRYTACFCATMVFF